MSNNPIADERAYWLAKLGIADDPNLSLSDLRNRTGGATHAVKAVEAARATLGLPVVGASKTAVVTAPAVSTFVIWQAPKAVTVTGVRAFRNGGTGATINAQVNALDLLAADLSLATADSWTAAPAVQNTAMAVGDSLKIAVRSVAGGPAYITFQIDYSEA